MVNFVATVDPRDKRRSTFIKKTRMIISPVEGLTVSSFTNDDFSAIWAGGDWTPVSLSSDKEGAAIIFGDAIREAKEEHLTATELRHLWSRPGVPEALNGFHAVVTYSPKNKLTVSADLLGLFPIYYYASEDVILVGSSIELFKLHPSFKTKLNPEGLVGIFLTKGIFDGQTLFSGVRRLGPGNLLVFRDAEHVEEIPQFRLPVSERYFDLTLSEQVEVLDQAMHRSIRRHVPKGKEHCLMLSGGLDSSLLAGYLKKNDSNFFTVTEGIETDNEMRCAKSIANVLGLKHVQFNTGYLGYARCAELAVKWQHLQDGFAGTLFWNFYPHLRKISTRVVTGFMGDGTLGNFNDWARSGPKESVSFERYFKILNSTAFRPQTLKKLLKDDEARDLISVVLRKIKKVYDSYNGRDFQRIWCFHLNHRQRFHAASGVWLLSFGSWPVLPYADVDILEAAGGMPNNALIDRRLEKELFVKKLPMLSQLSLSRTNFDTTPLMPTPFQRAAQQLYGNTGVWRSKHLREFRNILLLKLRGERRYWRRTTTGFDSPGWREVRRIAEPHLKLTSNLLDQKMVREFVPTPEASYVRSRFEMKNAGLSDNTSPKLLTGFALWLERNIDLLSNQQTDS